MPPYVAHWDDVPTWRVDTGALHVTRQDLGRAAGSRGASVRRQTIDPGARPTPAHSHGRDEEFFYVLGGTGLSWQDGLTHEVGPGDFLFHPAGGAAHTLIAGDDGLDVLAFGPETSTSATHLPRARVFWMGTWWVESPGPPAPFDREPEEIDGEPGDRPPTTVHLDDLEGTVEERGAAHITKRDVGRTTGSTRTGMRHVVIAPGRTGYPLHCHSAEEEIFVVLGGDGVAILGDEEHPVRRGSVVARPPATRVCHGFRAGDEPLEYLAWGTREPNDIAYYARSGKVYLRGVGVMGRIEPLDYWWGEE